MTDTATDIRTKLREQFGLLVDTSPKGEAIAEVKLPGCLWSVFVYEEDDGWLVSKTIRISCQVAGRLDWFHPTLSAFLREEAEGAIFGRIVQVEDDDLSIAVEHSLFPGVTSQQLGIVIKEVVGQAARLANNAGFAREQVALAKEQEHPANGVVMPTT